MKSKKKMSLRAKIMLSLLSIVAILLVSNVISIIEFTKMSSAVADILLQEEMACCQEEGEILRLRCAQAQNDDGVLRHVDTEGDSRHGDTDDVLRHSNTEGDSRHSEVSVVSEESCASLDPSLRYTSHQDDEEQPSISDKLEILVQNYYRSIFPGVVATFAGILLVLMLLYFILTMYVNPLRRMVDSLDAFRTSHKPYKYEFQGDDELAKLNEGILEITESNLELRRRNKELKNK